MGNARARTSKKVVVKIDPLLMKQWNETVKRLARSKTAGAAAWDEYWEAFAGILDHRPPLYLAGGFATEAAFLAAYAPEGRSVACHNMKVARVATPKDEEKYGTSKLLEAITFLEAKNGGPLKAPVDFGRIKIPVERDGQTRSVGLAEATGDAIREATRAVDKKATDSRKTSPVELAIEKALKPVGVNARQVRLARDVVTLRIKASALQRAGAALAKLRLP